MALPLIARTFGRDSCLKEVSVAQPGLTKTKSAESG